MRLWTIQSACRLGHLEADGALHGSWEHVLDGDDFYVRPYKWMVKQMESRIPGFSGNPPIWAKLEKPDLRFQRWHWGDRLLICIEFEAPDELVLLSDYVMWHSVLSNYPCTRSEADWNDYFERQDATTKVEDLNIVQERFQKESEDSWQMIFDRNLQADPKWVGTEPVEWQACADGLQKEWVRDIRVFQSRKTKD